MQAQNRNKKSPQEIEQLHHLADMSEIALANKSAMTALTILCSILSLAYIAEVIKGNRGIVYILITVVLSMGPVVLGWIFYKKEQASPVIMHIIGIGFAIDYLFLLFTANNNLVFTYVIPMLIVISLYDNIKYTTMIGSGVVIANLISIVLSIVLHGASAGQIVTFEIQGLVMAIICGYLILTARTNAKFTEIRTARLEIQYGRTAELLDRILGVSHTITSTVGEVASEMGSLKESVDQTLMSMEEVNQGTGDSAQAAQNQMVMTSQIKEHIDLVGEAAQKINENVSATADAVDLGRQNIDQMTKLTNQVDQAGKEVADVLRTFRDTTQQMNSITDLITNVASQTSLLALNASIEAARAGESGKGFAVVASEISNLAQQTTEATDNIVQLINSVSSQVGSMVDTIEKLLKSGEEESRCASETADSFRKISGNVEVIEKRSEELNAIVGRLTRANDEIVSSIETISSITEEVTAHASQTYSSSEHNQSIVSHINELVSELNENARELSAGEE